METNEGTLLGKKISYPKNYCPEILVAVPRKINREIYGITAPQHLFWGYDCWHAYEASFITRNGLPVCGLLKIVYPSDNEFLIESKSLKLYLNSLNMTALGNTVAEGVQLFCEKIRTDLSHLLQTEVNVHFHSEPPVLSPFDFNDYTVLEQEPAVKDCHFSLYQEHPAYLEENQKQYPGELKVCSHLLKSNCKITTQPDWGSIYIRLKAGHLPDTSALLRYIVSLRNENHFHEEICEMVFKRLTDIYQPEILMVSCLYTRRGGIDICPVRANRPEYLPTYLPQPNILSARTFRQ